MQLPWVDYAIVAIVGLSVITGLFRGFIKELIALCVWVLAIWIAITYSPMLEPWFQSYIQDHTARVVMSYVILILGTIILGGLFNALLSFILHRTGLSGTDRILGMGFGFVRGVFIVALLILVVQMTAIPIQNFTSNSRLYAKFNPLVDWLSGFTPHFIKQVSVLENKANVQLSG